MLSQSPEEEIDPQNINTQYLEHLIKIKIDSVRHGKGLIELVNDSVLYLASNHHSSVMSKKRSLSHFESLPRFKNPQKRAEAFGAVNYFTGENVAFCGIYKKYSNKYPEKNLIMTYEELAAKFVKGWVKSRGHYRNIIKKEYQITGVSVSYNPKTRTMYATQKFAEVKSKFVFNENTTFFPYEDENEVEYELKELKQVARRMHKGHHRWHVKKRKRKGRRCKQCDEVAYKKDQFSFYVDSLNNIHCVNADGRLFKRLTRMPRDGMAIEIVRYKDYECESKNYFLKPSRRNAQCIANGTIQKPVYKWKLRKTYRKVKLAWNYMKWKKIFGIIFKLKFRQYPEAFLRIPAMFPGCPSDNIIGKLPVNDSDYYECNILFIKSKRLCNILNFTDYCGEYFSNVKPAPFLPELSKAEYRYPEDTLQYAFSVNFKQGKTQYKREDMYRLMDTIHLDKYAIVKMHIEANASVEGDEELNKRIAAGRALSLRKALDTTRVDSLLNDIEVKEDWTHFYKNVETTPFSYLKKLSKKEVKKVLLKPDLVRQLEPILDEERQAKIKLWLMLIVPDSIRTKQALKRYQQLMDSANNNKPSAYYASRLFNLQTYLYKLEQQHKIPASVLTSKEPPSGPYYAKLHFNYLIFKSNNDSSVNKSIYEEAIYNDLADFALTSKASQIQRYNFLNLLINRWDSTSYPESNKKMQPSTLFKWVGSLSSSAIPKDTLERLKLNFYFKAANWFYFIDSDPKSHLRALNNIYYHYRNRSNTDSTAYKIARYFIFYNSNEYAYRILAPYALQKKPNHEVFKLYLKMAFVKDMYKPRSRFYRLMKTAPGILGREEYCGLFTGPCNMSFQIFDHEEVRQTWCRECASYKNFALKYREFIQQKK